MSGSKKDSQTKSETSPEKEVEVLYQKLGGRWFAFSVVNDEVYVGQVEEGEDFHTPGADIEQPPEQGA